MRGKDGLEASRSAIAGIPGVARALVLAAAVALAAGARPAEAGDDAHYDRVTLRAERMRQVANDEAQAQLGITLEDRDSVELQDRVNEIMQWAVRVSEHYEAVDAETGGYRTHPVYRNERIDHWRATQELRIESQDVDRITELIRTLQSRLQLQSVQFSVSQERREEVENELIAEAIQAFQERAELVRKQLGATDHRIVHLEIQTAASAPGSTPFRAMRAMAEADTAPALEPGSSSVTVGVEGTLELRTN